VATFFRNVALAGTELQMAKWPTTEAFVARLLGHSSFKKLEGFEKVSVRTPIAKHHDALREAGAPIAATSFFDPEPRRGILAV
jgi:hypothetical protein